MAGAARPDCAARIVVERGFMPCRQNAAASRWIREAVRAPRYWRGLNRKCRSPRELASALRDRRRRRRRRGRARQWRGRRACAWRGLQRGAASSIGALAVVERTRRQIARTMRRGASAAPKWGTRPRNCGGLASPSFATTIPSPPDHAALRLPSRKFAPAPNLGDATGATICAGSANTP